MKTKLVLLITLISLNAIFAQQDIDVTSQVKNIEIPIDPGSYIFNIVNANKDATYSYKVEKKNLEIEKIETPSDFGVSLAVGVPITIPIGKFTVEKGQQLKIIVKESVEIVNPKTKKKEIKTTTFEYIYNTPKRGEWRTTFGFNFIYKIKQNTYFSNANDDGSYTITEGSNKDKLDFHPTLMFTWLSNKHLDKKDNWHFGLSGGLGYDFDESLSVFAGPSFIYNENITLTFGIAFHNQKRLSSNYSKGDIINENLTFDQLHTDYIRVNPFISLSFRLDRNPFGS